MARKKGDLLQGSLDLLILKTLSTESLHGWAISKRIRQWSSGVLEVNQGSLYPALYRLEDRGWIEAEWGVSPEGRRAKFYQLTRAGEEQLLTEREQWRLFSGAVQAILAAG
jgi:PadR family transcriptional regulator, regulatory protein PadR